MYVEKRGSGSINLVLLPLPSRSSLRVYCCFLFMGFEAMAWICSQVSTIGALRILQPVLPSSALGFGTIIFLLARAQLLLPAHVYQPRSSQNLKSRDLRLPMGT